VAVHHPKTAAAAWPISAARGWWTVSALGLLYVLSFVDRVILALLVSPLKAELHVSDVQLALLFGPAFALFYAVLGLPIARLADRGDRRKLILAGVFLWGAATVGSAFAGSFWMLVALRVGLAVGEAALTPSAYSMIGDLFPPHRRAAAASLYSALGMAGASGAYILGAIVIQLVGHAAAPPGAAGLGLWRLVFIIVGAPSLLMGLVVAFTTREPARSVATVAPKFSEVLGYLRRNLRLYSGLFVGAGLTQAIGYAYVAWGPEFLHRRYEWSIPHAGYVSGLIGLAAGFGGTLAAPAISRRLEAWGRTDGVILASLGLLVIGGICAVIAPLQAHVEAFLALNGVASFCLVGVANNIVVSMQMVAPARMRATLVAGLLMCITLLGLGLGPTLVAVIGSRLSPDGQGLGPGLAILAAGISVPAFCLLLWARSRFAQLREQEL
jgi:MFS family permease